MGWRSSTRRGGGQKVRYAPRNQGNQTFFGGISPGFCRDIPGAPEKFEKKKFGFDFRSLKLFSQAISDMFSTSFETFGRQLVTVLLLWAVQWFACYNGCSWELEDTKLAPDL